VEVIGEFLGVLVVGVGEFEFEFTFFGAQDDGLPFHAADHVEGGARLAAQGHLQQVLFDPGLDGLAQLALDLEEAIGRAEPADALMRALVVVVFYPQFDPLAGGVEAVELGAGEEVLPEAGPEAFDLAEGHGMLRTRLEVGHAILLQLRLEARGAAPRGVLAAVVREHLLGRFELGHGLAIDLDDRLGRRAAEEIRADDEARVIVQERHDIGVTSAEPEGEDVRLPHLVGRGPLKETRAGEVAPFGGVRWRHEFGLMQLVADGLGAGLEEEHAAQPLRDALDAEGGMLLLERHDLGGDRRRELGRALGGRGMSLEPRFAELAVLLDPAREGLLADPGLLGDEPAAEALLQIQADGLDLELERIAALRLFAAPRVPPRGVWLVLLLYRCCFFIHLVALLFNFGVSTTFTLSLIS
jgi:hypothetical protein